MDILALSETTWRGQPAWRIAGNRRAAVITAIGGHLAAITALDGELNPLWQPQWAGGDPATVRPGPACPWGEGPEASLLAGIAGSNLCVPIFGGPARGQRLPVHGDAGVSRWRLVEKRPVDAAVFAVRTPISGLDVERRLRIDGDAIELATTVRHGGTAPLELDWCEHTTIGGDFLDGVAVSAGIDAAWTSATEPEPGSNPRFPARSAAVAPAAALAVPAAADPPCGDVLAGRVAEGWWKAENRRLGWRLAARWDRDAFPWLALWTQHRSRIQPPWAGRERTRGLEMSTRPFPEPRSYAGPDGCFQGRPAVCRVPPGAGLTKTVRFAWERMA